MTPRGAISAYGRDPERSVSAADRPMLPGDWVDHAPPSEGMRLYASVVGARIHLVVFTLAITVAVAALFVARADKVYQAQAGLLVTPISRGNTNLFGLGLVAETGDPTRDAETVSQLITTRAVAERVREELRLSQSPSELLDAVTAQPVAQSSIVAVTAETGDPALAAALADAFAEAAIAVRTERMRALLDDLIPRLEEQLASVPLGETRERDALGGRIRDLEALRPLPDPTLHLETRAAQPNSPIAPRPALTLAAALIAGLILGISIVLLTHLLSTRIEREDELRRYRIPIVGRIPQERWWRRLRRSGPLSPTELSPPTIDAFRRIAGSLSARTDGGERAVFVTSPGIRDGKTTVSLNLAGTLTAFGQTVVLVDADSHRPSLADVVPTATSAGLSDVLTGRASLAEALGPANRSPYGLRGVLTQVPGDGAASVPMTPEAVDSFVYEVGSRAEWLVFDGPALTYAPNALPFAKRASILLVVVRLGVTRERDLSFLADLLIQQDIAPDGFVVIGGSSHSSS